MNAKRVVANYLLLCRVVSLAILGVTLCVFYDVKGVYSVPAGALVGIPIGWASHCLLVKTISLTDFLGGDSRKMNLSVFVDSFVAISFFVMGLVFIQAMMKQEHVLASVRGIANLPIDTIKFSVQGYEICEIVDPGDVEAILSQVADARLNQIGFPRYASRFQMKFISSGNSLFVADARIIDKYPQHVELYIRGAKVWIPDVGDVIDRCCIDLTAK